METVNPVVWIVLAVVIIAGLIFWLVVARNRSNRLRNRFGDEYDRTIETVGHTGRAEAELEERQRRVASLDIRPLDSEERERFTQEWTDVKSLFVDSPAEAVLHADRTLTNMMALRGFPMADFERRHADLTVDHPEVASRYRQGHEIADRIGEASTEDLRMAMIHFEALFDELIADGAHAAPKVERIR